MFVVEGVNRAKKHVANPIKGVAGGIVDKDMRRSISPTLLCSTRQPAEADRVGFKRLKMAKKGSRVQVRTANW